MLRIDNLSLTGGSTKVLLNNARPWRQPLAVPRTNRTVHATRPLRSRSRVDRATQSKQRAGSGSSGASGSRVLSEQGWRPGGPERPVAGTSDRRVHVARPGCGSRLCTAGKKPSNRAKYIKLYTRPIYKVSVPRVLYFTVGFLTIYFLGNLGINLAL